MQRTLRWDTLTAVAMVVLVAAVVQLAAGATRVGVTFDEPTHVDRTNTWLDDGWYVPSASLAEGRPDPDDPNSTPYVYGPAFAIVAHGANIVAGNDSSGEVSSSASAHAVRHLIVALIALLAGVGVATAVWALTRSWRFGVWGAAALFAIPAWTGQALFNVKDVPAAAGYTLVTAGLVVALCAPGRTRTGRALAIGALIGFGVFIGAGTRLSLWVPVLASLASYAALQVGRRWSGEERDPAADIAVAAGAALGIATVWAIYPKAFAEPLKLLVHSVSDSAGYPIEIVTLTAGQLLPTNPPFWYLPAWFAASIPILIGGLALVGAIVGVRALLRSDDGGPFWRAALRRPELGLLLVIQQAVLLPAAAIVGHGVMYDGLRQHLYVVPAIAILAAVGAQRLSARALSVGPAGARRPIVLALLSVALVVPMVAQARLFPYNYAYLNPVAELGGVNGRWETDYWFASAPEALEHVPRGVKLRCSTEIVLKRDPNEELDADPCRGPYFDPFLDRRGDDAAEDGGGSRDAWLILINRADNRPPPYCEEADDVTRDLLGASMRMSYVLRCDPARLR